MKLENKVIGIIGAGLIGGSLALNLAQQGLKVALLVRNKQNFIDKNANKLKANSFYFISEDFSDLQKCDFIFICTPLREILNTLELIIPYLKPEVIITDVGSVKTNICQQAQLILAKTININFVGGHPMAGTEKIGFENAFAELFTNRPWALMTEAQKFPELIELISLTKANIIFTAAQEHDQAVSLISHLPLLLSIGLLNTVNNYADSNIKDLALQLASSGFDGMTRLAKGNQVLNEDLLKLNSSQIQKAYFQFCQEIKTCF